MRRCVLAFVVLAALASASAAAQSDGATAAPAQPSRRDSELLCTRTSDRQHVVGVDFDFGGGHASSGVRYLHTHRSRDGCRDSPVGGTTWLAYGMSLRTNDLKAGAAYAIGRAGAFGHSVFMGLDGGVGAAADTDRSFAASFIGFFLSFYYFELGGTYHFPIAADRPAWLPGWQFAFRIHIPVYTYAESEHRYAPREE